MTGVFVIQIILFFVVAFKRITVGGWLQTLNACPALRARVGKVSPKQAPPEGATRLAIKVSWLAVFNLGVGLLAYGSLGQSALLVVVDICMVLALVGQVATSVMDGILAH